MDDKIIVNNCPLIRIEHWLNIEKILGKVIRLGIYHYEMCDNDDFSLFSDTETAIDENYQLSQQNYLYINR